MFDDKGKGYKATKISTIVDITSNLPNNLGYKATKISTIVDLSSVGLV